MENPTDEDVGAYREAPPGPRIWCGATVETKGKEAPTPWLGFAYATAKADLAKGCCARISQPLVQCPIG